MNLLYEILYKMNCKYSDGDEYLGFCGVRMDEKPDKKGIFSVPNDKKSLVTEWISKRINGNLLSKNHTFTPRHQQQMESSQYSSRERAHLSYLPAPLRALASSRIEILKAINNSLTVADR